MSKVAADLMFTGSYTGISTYDYTKTCLGTLMRQESGTNRTDRWVGPAPILVARVGDVADDSNFTHVLHYSDRYNWIFTADLVTAAVTRRINMFTHDKYIDALSYNGQLTAGHANIAGNKSINGFRAFLTRHSGGTVAVNGFNVVGSGTAFSGERVSCGARIGFGTVDYNQITNWYEISGTGIQNDTSLTLTASGSYASGTPYVIEDLRIGYTSTNSVPGSGGLFVLKGLRPELFNPSSYNISDSSNIDNQRSIYWLTPTSTGGLIGPRGLAVDSVSSPTGHYAYVLDNGFGPRVFKFDLRAQLTGITNSGQSNSAFLFPTASGTALIGGVSQTNNGRIVTCNHGPGAGVKSFYFATTTRIYRSTESAITSGSSVWITDAMTENPAGGINTYPASATMIQVDYSDFLDRFFISTSGNRMHVTQYRTDGAQFDHIILSDNKQIDGASADSNSFPFPNTSNTIMNIWTEDGYGYMLRANATNNVSQLYVHPIASDWTYAGTTNQRVISPRISTPGALKFYRVFVNNATYVGTEPLGLPTEPYRIYTRTAGITDNSGGWTLLDDTHDLSAVAASDSIQFMFEFKTLGALTIPARIYGFTVVYEDTSTDSHFQPSVANSNTTTKAFAWRHSTAFGGNVPALRVRLYDATNNNLLSDDNTSSPAGTFERSINTGSSWSAWTNTDKSNESTYVRYTPASLADNIKVKALLTQL